MWIWIWLGIACASLIIELVTLQMVTIWFVPSAIIALILAACNVMVEIQVVVFIVLSLILILSLRKISLKFLLKTKAKTNSEALIGKKTKLLSPIKDGEGGTIKVNGIIWTAIGENETIAIDADKTVEILSIDGIKLIVKECNDK